MATAVETNAAATNDPTARKRVLRPIRSIPRSRAAREDIEIKYWERRVSAA